MSSISTRYQIYVADTLELAKTLVVKYAATADAMNTALTNSGYSVDIGDPTQWKYYQNLAGVGYIDANGTVVDPVMQINSVIGDGQIGSIAFTRQNIQTRPSTLRAYAYGSYFYNALLSRYPNSEMQILGVVYPIVEYPLQQDPTGQQGITDSIAAAIAAADGQILQYNTALVEPQETDLIPRVQTWIQQFLERWCIPEYSITDDMYLSTMLGVLYVNLPGVIMNIRLSNCHTNRAHSFHIQEYLESNGMLGQYVPYMNTQQMLWLYRNVRWAERNAGKQSTFADLVQNIMTAGGLPLAGYDIRHNTTPMQGYTSLVPDVEMFSNPINFISSGSGSQIETVEYILNKEVAFSRNGNLDVTDANTYAIEAMQSSVQSRMPTKVLESSLEDTKDSVTYPLADVLLNNWVYSAVNGLYEADVFVTMPGSSTPLQLSPLNAFILFLYTWAYGNTLDNSVHPGKPFEFPFIPSYKATNIFIGTDANGAEAKPTMAQLLSVVDDKLVTVAQLTPILNGSVDTTVKINSPDLFYSTCQIRQQQMMANRDYYCSAVDFRTRGYLEFSTSLLYKDVELNLVGSYTTYADWLANNGISFTNLSQADAAAFAYDILQTATGANLTGALSMQSIQAAMLAVMTRLSSYDVQYLQSINTTANILEDAAAIRIGDLTAEIFDAPLVPIPTAWSDNPTASASDAYSFVNYDVSEMGNQTTVHDAAAFQIQDQVSMQGEFVDSLLVPISAVRAVFMDPETVALSSTVMSTSDYQP